VLLHFCQPIELGSKELGRAKPNGGMTYPKADEVSKRLPVFYEPLMVPTLFLESKPNSLMMFEHEHLRYNTLLFSFVLVVVA